MSMLQPLPEHADEVAAQAINPDAAAALEQLRAGARFVALRSDDVGYRAAALEAVIDRCSQGDAKLVWIGNPLRSPLTIERVFLQAVGAAADLRVERSPAELAAMLVRSAGAASRLILIVQQPETLDPDARETIAALAACLPERDPQVQFLFSGTASFDLLVAGTDQEDESQPSAPVLACPEQRLLAVSRPRRELLPVFMLLLLIGLGVVAAPRLLDRAQVSTSAESEPIADHSATAAIPQPPTVDTAALRREFDAFLAQRARSIPDLSESQKDALFQEFLSHHRQRRDAL